MVLAADGTPFIKLGLIICMRAILLTIEGSAVEPEPESRDAKFSILEPAALLIAASSIGIPIN